MEDDEPVQHVVELPLDHRNGAPPDAASPLQWRAPIGAIPTILPTATRRTATVTIAFLAWPRFRGGRRTVLSDNACIELPTQGKPAEHF